MITAYIDEKLIDLIMCKEERQMKLWKLASVTIAFILLASTNICSSFSIPDNQRSNY